MSQALTGAVRLTDWGVIRAEGEDAAKFLHSQLTQDFALLGMGEARLAGFCSAKGRLLATLIGWKQSETCVLLALPLELLPAIQKRLSMFVLRAKCKLSDATAEIGLWGAQGPAESSPRWSLQREGETTRIRLPDGGLGARWLIAQPAGLPLDLPVISAQDWQWGALESGLPTVLAATSEQFVPQMLNLELLGGVNFQKGCYPGQEVVARSQYRGTLKRRTYLYALDGTAAPGQEIFHSGDPGQPAGLVANSAQRGAQSLVLAETKIAALASGSLHLGAPDGPLLTPRALPYALTEPE
jgi:folate-binding protein YgfZ